MENIYCFLKTTGKNMRFNWVWGKNEEKVKKGEGERKKNKGRERGGKSKEKRGKREGENGKSDKREGKRGKLSCGFEEKYDSEKGGAGRGKNMSLTTILHFTLLRYCMIEIYEVKPRSMENGEIQLTRSTLSYDYTCFAGGRYFI